MSAKTTKRPDDPISNWGSLETPYSQEAEYAAIGSAVVNGHQFGRYLKEVKPNDFFLLRSRYIWEAMQGLYERNEPIDYLTVCEALKDAGRLAEIGGPAHITQLINQTPSSAEGVFYCKLVRRDAIRRQVMAFSDALKGQALDLSITVEDVLGYIEKFKDIEPPPAAKLPASLKDVASQLYDDMEARINKKQTVIGIPTGYVMLDDVLGGWMPDTFTIWGGRPGMGKTSIMFESGMRVAETVNPVTNERYVVLFVSLEMSRIQLGNRALSRNAQVTTRRVIHKGITASEISAMTRGMGQMANTNLYIEEPEGRFGMDELDKLMRTCRSEYGHVDMVMVDYLQLMKNKPNGNKNRTRENEVSEISHEAKQFSRLYHVPLHMAAQLNKEVEKRADKHPRLDDLRESDALAADPDIILFPFFQGYYDMPRRTFGTFEVYGAKNRDGEPGFMMEMYADFRFMKFTENT